MPGRLLLVFRHAGRRMRVAPSRLYVAQNEPLFTEHREEMVVPGEVPDVAGLNDDNINSNINKCLPSFSKLKERALWCPETKTNIMCYDTQTGRQFFRTCQKDSCLYCAPARCWWKGRAIRLSKPTHIVTVTNVGSEWPVINKHMKAFHRQLRKLDPTYQSAWAVESNPRGTGNHAHAWARLKETDISLDGIGERIGTGFAEAEVLRTTTGPVTYLMKTVTSLAGEPLSSAKPTFERYLANNGGRLLHSTQGFWPEYEGNRHIKNAERLAKRRHRGPTNKERYLHIPTDRVGEFFGIT